jgi:hypothetical protein
MTAPRPNYFDAESFDNIAMASCTVVMNWAGILPNFGIGTLGLGWDGSRGWFQPEHTELYQVMERERI